jgi:hypothetical protein
MEKNVFIGPTAITDITMKLIKVEISQKYQYDDKMDFKQMFAFVDFIGRKTCFQIKDLITFYSDIPPQLRFTRYSK